MRFVWMLGIAMTLGAVASASAQSEAPQDEALDVGACADIDDADFSRFESAKADYPSAIFLGDFSFDVRNGFCYRPAGAQTFTFYPTQRHPFDLSITVDLVAVTLGGEAKKADIDWILFDTPNRQTLRQSFDGKAVRWEGAKFSLALREQPGTAPLQDGETPPASPSEKASEDNADVWGADFTITLFGRGKYSPAYPLRLTGTAP